MNDADVIIVGAGPAGATNALLLARAGIDVLLLARRPFPRDKPCGDCLSAGAGAVLQRLGLSDAVHALPHAELRGWRIVAPDGAMFEAEFGAGGLALAVERRLLDAAILETAAAAGARVAQLHVTGVLREGRSVTGVCGRSTARYARLVIGADGLRSIVAAQLNAIARAPRLRKLSLTMHVQRELITDAFGEMHVGDGIGAGIAPVTADGACCNVTVVADADRFGRAAASDARGFALSALTALPRARGRLGVQDIAHIDLLASGPFDRPARDVVFDGAALVGDAAGYYDPFTGQGIFQALASAELLAACVLDALQQPGTIERRHLARYAAQRAALLRGARVVQRGIEHVLSRPALANRSIARIARAPALAQSILGVTGDVLPARSLLSPRTLSSLLIPPPEGRSTQ